MPPRIQDVHSWSPGVSSCRLIEHFANVQTKRLPTAHRGCPPCRQACPRAHEHSLMSKQEGCLPHIEDAYPVASHVYVPTDHLTNVQTRIEGCLPHIEDVHPVVRHVHVHIEHSAPVQLHAALHSQAGVQWARHLQSCAGHQGVHRHHAVHVDCTTGHTQRGEEFTVNWTTLQREGKRLDWTMDWTTPLGEGKRLDWTMDWTTPLGEGKRLDWIMDWTTPLGEGKRLDWTMDWTTPLGEGKRLDWTMDWTTPLGKEKILEGIVDYITSLNNEYRLATGKTRC